MKSRVIGTSLAVELISEFARESERMEEAPGETGWRKLGSEFSAERKLSCHGGKLRSSTVFDTKSRSFKRSRKKKKKDRK